MAKKKNKTTKKLEKTVCFKQIKPLNDQQLDVMLKSGVDPKAIWAEYFSVSYAMLYITR